MPLRRRSGHLLGLGVFLLLVGVWLAGTYSRLGFLNRDWVAFDAAGWRGLGGNWSSVYTVSSAERWPYLYPPYAIVLSLPLGMLPFWPSYLVTVLLAVAGIWWSCRRLFEIFGSEHGRYPVFCSTLLCAPVTLQVLITGQYSWLYLMSLAGVATYWQRNDDRHAGRSLALLALKPNLAILALPLFVVQRKWSLLRHAGRDVALAVLVTLPFSLRAWPAFFDAARGVAQRQEAGDAPIEKQITMLAFLRVASGGLDGSSAIWILWLVVAVALGAASAVVWRRADAETPIVRLVGMAALAIVALSPRLYFYDGLVVAVPAAAWYLGRSGYTYRWVRRLEGLCLLSITVVTAVFFPRPSVVTIFGPLAGIWLLLEAVDLSAGQRARRSRSGVRSHADPLMLAS